MMRHYQEFGLSLTWNPKDREDIRRHHSKLLRELKRNYGVSSIEDIPGFLDSIEQQHYVFGDSFEDIGATCGLSRERIRQCFEDYELLRRKKLGPTYRIWNDKRNLFVPVSGERMNDILEETERRTREEELEGIKEMQIYIIKELHKNTIREFANENGRRPMIRELLILLGYKPFSSYSVANYWGYGSDDDVSCTEAFDNLYRAAGFKKRTRQGNPKPRKPNTIGARLTKQRLEMGLTQEEVSDMTNLSNISEHELNRKRPKNETLEKYSRLYKVTKKWILTGKKFRRKKRR